MNSSQNVSRRVISREFSNLGSISILPDGPKSPSVSMEFVVGSEKMTMQNLNDRLASYLDKVKTLEQKNSDLELRIRHALEMRGPKQHDYSRYETVLTQLRKEIQEMNSSNAQLALKIDTSSLAVQDFKTKFEHELQIRQNAESDIGDLRKFLDDINVHRLYLENDVETLNDQLITLKKTHQQEMTEVRDQVFRSGVQVDVDAAKGKDLTQIIEEMRVKYEKMVLKNQEELSALHESQTTNVILEIDSAALEGARHQIKEKRENMQSLEAELQTQTRLKASLVGSLEEVQLHNNMKMERYNAIIFQEQSELTELRSRIQQQMQEYTILLNVKGELEAEIETYKKHLDGQEDDVQPTLR
ncbi:keratin, type I cytoskeletal 18-like [Hoplias malabaricus]|uniref:keratin, type I cytoskeletal 18-like n=1 Tax=Hoplias malabaricus TaxID=27720 RepID=UPI00346275DD